MEEDLIEEILVCLPVKSLCRCKCLSKEWNFFISYNKRFRRRYLDSCTDPDLGRFLMLGLFVVKNDFPNVVSFLPTSTNGTTTNMLMTKKRKRNQSDIVGGIPLITIDKSLDFTTTHHSPYIEGCSNGFLLCNDHNDRDYFICNPITKHCIHLPAVNYNYRCESECITHGFICHSGLDTPLSYTVMRAIRSNHILYGNTLTMEILSSDEPEQWTVFVLRPQFSFNMNSRPYSAISENGVIYITAQTPNADCFLVFDRKTSIHSLQLLEFPEPPNRVFTAMSDGLLVCIYWKDHHISIWVLDHKNGLDFTKQWSLKHSGMLPWEGKGCNKVIGCHPLDPFILFIRTYKKAFLYDARNSRVEEVICSEHLRSNGSRLFPYTCGLVGHNLFRDR